MRLQQREAEAEHAGALLPAIDAGAARRIVEGKVPEDGEPVRMAARRLDRELVGVGIPGGGRVDHRRVHPRLVHLAQQVVR